MKPDIKSDYEASFYNTDKKAIVYYYYYKRVESSDYDVPDDEAEVEIDKIDEKLLPLIVKRSKMVNIALESKIKKSQIIDQKGKKIRLKDKGYYHQF